MTAIERREDRALRRFGRLGDWFDDRLALSHFADSALNHIFPDNWSFMLGEVAMYCFVILVITGIYMTFFFHASDTQVVYSGSYVPLRGVRMSDAYASAIHLSFDIRAGLVIRQIHHWAADLFAASLVCHLCRVFFTGAFRRPREVNWVIGLTMFILVIFNGFVGYSLPDDLLSATGLRIGYSIALSVPLIGTWISSLFFGGQFPGPETISRLYVIHVLLFPAAIALLLSVHLAIVWRQRHTQFPAMGRTEHNVVGSKLWPTYTAKSIGLFAGVVAVLSLLGGVAQINPIWLYGPYRTGAVTTAAQPDWYMGWLEGALRIFPGWRIHVFSHTVPEVFWPGAVLPTFTFGMLYLWPFIERRLTRDVLPHELLDRPRNRPARTALGTGVLAFYLVLFAAGSQDIIAQHLGVSVVDVDYTFRGLVVGVPIVVAFITYHWAAQLAAEDMRISESAIRGGPLVVGAGVAAQEPRTGAPHLVQRVEEVAGKVGSFAALAAGVAIAWRGRRKARR
ncbi:MAG TPA: ubiquinol-cytochrome c reductase cytochrome b subunit [Acidimicrobiales bacterium]|nr:ubiquinol-cytochrome c reductase cytochrome b subunit [Acidimicrobiales bacterium]